MEQIHDTWIKGALEPSLTNISYIHISLLSWTMADALKSAQQVPISSSDLVNAYHASGHRFIILGDEGAGKTTLLLEMLRGLLLQAEQDEQAPIPVMFHLASWTTKCQPLEKWLDEEWKTLYPTGKFNAGEFLVLLDGFDTIREELQCICYQAINAYQNLYPHIPLVLCCRNMDYERFQEPVKPHSVVQLQLLSADQIDAYISSTPCGQVAVRKLLDADPELYALLHRPLPLAMLTALYQESTPVAITGKQPAIQVSTKTPVRAT
ncbi:NACHT domain-containing protein [Dictyobacter kobayashii]|uniref:NACHT domain-containing protein n=1 Tax=Dictyobacter kobayashii TaxID=2014872 RepID=A0A402ALQ2_9CHLR|nr:NACHT domain-containing protein [Dictyobacter kobayashii]GCE20128.1 hypothetical protein KDK_39280 [Dictyobacter kobayashii]